jgi:hypothetical protein
MTQVIVVVEGLIAKRTAKHPLRHQGRRFVLNQVRTAMVAEASGKPVDQPDPSIGCRLQEPAGIRSDRAAIKGGHDFTTFNTGKAKPIEGTLYFHRGRLSLCALTLSQNEILRVCAPMPLLPLRFPG